jgi:hypothetical protein
MTPFHLCVTLAMSRRRNGICLKKPSMSSFAIRIFLVGSIRRMYRMHDTTLSTRSKPIGLRGSKSIPSLTDNSPPELK